MTQDDFDKTNWESEINVIYQVNLYKVVACDLSERLVMLDAGVGKDDFFWVRCKNISLPATEKD